MEILKVQQLCKTYGSGEAKVDALKNVSFSLEKGQFAAVVGESGSGKSTLLNCFDICFFTHPLCSSVQFPYKVTASWNH